MNQAIVTPSGRQMHLVLEPWKNIGDYYKIAVAIKINISDLKEIEIKTENNQARVNQGSLRMIFDGFVISDRKNKWGHKPLYWFMSMLFEKYFFKEHYQKAETWIRSDVEDLHNKIKTYLNSFTQIYGR